MLPLTVLFLFPDSSLFKILCLRCSSLFIYSLNEPHIADDSNIISKQSHMRLRHRDIDSSFRSSHVEVEVMKFHTLNEVTISFWFKTCKCWIAKRCISFPVSSLDALKQSLGQLNQLLLHFINYNF